MNTEKLYGTERFRSLTRKPTLKSPDRFEPVSKAPGSLELRLGEWVVVGDGRAWQSLGTAMSSHSALSGAIPIARKQ